MTSEEFSRGRRGLRSVPCLRFGFDDACELRSRTEAARRPACLGFGTVHAKRHLRTLVAIRENKHPLVCDRKVFLWCEGAGESTAADGDRHVWQTALCQAVAGCAARGRLL